MPGTFVPFLSWGHSDTLLPEVSATRVALLLTPHQWQLARVPMHLGQQCTVGQPHATTTAPKLLN